MIFVFKIRIKRGRTEAEYIKAWKNGSAIIQKQPGALGTRLYHKIDEPGTLIAIATWKSKEARDKAMRVLNKDRRVKDIITKHQKYGNTYILGNFNGPTETVKPK